MVFTHGYLLVVLINSFKKIIYNFLILPEKKERSET